MVVSALNTIPSSLLLTFQEAAAKNTQADGDSAYHKAEDVVSTMLAKGFILGKDAMNRAKVLDEKHRYLPKPQPKLLHLIKGWGLVRRSVLVVLL